MRDREEPKGFISWEDAEPRKMYMGCPVAPDRVKVYFNLQKDCLSVVDTSTGRLYCHSYRVELKDARFHVNENGRQRVVREKRKNVHAYVIGTWINQGDHQAYRFEKGKDGNMIKVWGCNCRNEGKYSWCENCIPESGEEFKGAYYNPYKYKTFVEDISKKPIFKSKRVIIRDKTAIGPHYNIFYKPEPKKKRLAWNAGLRYTFKQLRADKQLETKSI
jgi:hypothetical protein